MKAVFSGNEIAGMCVYATPDEHFPGSAGIGEQSRRCPPCPAELMPVFGSGEGEKPDATRHDRAGRLAIGHQPGCDSSVRQILVCVAGAFCTGSGRHETPPLDSAAERDDCVY